MRVRMTLVLLSVAAVIPAVAVRALERTSVLAGDDEDEWVRSAPCAIQYYNNCTGWLWWDGLTGDEKVGVLIDTCGGGTALLEQVSMYSWSTGYPQGVSTVSIHEVDAEGAPIFPALAQQGVPYDCGTGYGCTVWRTLTMNVEVPPTFMVLYRQNADWWGQFRIYYDHPAAAPSSPPACGYCYPTTRVTRTFWWPPGPITGPGQRPNDGTCDCEMLVRCTLTPLVTAVDPATDPMSWGGVKALYR